MFDYLTPTDVVRHLRTQSVTEESAGADSVLSVLDSLEKAIAGLTVDDVQALDEAEAWRGHNRPHQPAYFRRLP
ncbi:hypothetical protein [Streptomyces natalensis]|uniref:Uncharacterized protein n=1 Tax=Streptomyces natalensis ATCC 27448 TaxID=1240678 RepID=A0A0D7CKM6_9ACTN|nr:hypothetical protein [Streptomyces natalensis]KIZ16759.1 hypothetical protein SNA_17265 [Streptomyces natalensis ATCC 27448]